MKKVVQIIALNHRFSARRYANTFFNFLNHPSKCYDYIQEGTPNAKLVYKICTNSQQCGDKFGSVSKFYILPLS
jgi:hypothetical protein